MCSFRGDTLVKTRDGFTAIRDVRAGEDYVWSRDARTGEMGWKSVLAQYSNPYDETVHVTIRDVETGAQQTITSNRIHPFFVQVPQANGLSRLASTGTDNAVPRSSEGHDYRGPIADGHWVDAADLKPGYRLLNDDESWAEVVSVEVETKALKAYNLTIADFQTYFVKEAANDNAQPVWVHNACNVKIRSIARQISRGHAYTKHVVKKDEFRSLGIKTAKQLQDHIEYVMNNPTAVKQLERGRIAYWHERTKTVVISNPNTRDGGTAFRPRDGRAYFDWDLR